MNPDQSKAREAPRETMQPDNGWKPCKCHECGQVSVCTPGNDFYVRPENEDTGLLTCESCLMKPYRGRPVLIADKEGKIIGTESGHN